MPVVIRDFNRCTYAHTKNDNEFLTLKQYDREAQNIIARFAPKYKNRLLKDEDAISFIIEKMALADAKFDPTLGVKRSTYRIAYGKTIVLTYIQCLDDLRNPYIELSQFIEDDCRGPVETLIDRETKAFIDDALTILDPTEKEVIELWAEDKTINQISKITKLPRNQAEEVCGAALRKLENWQREKVSS